MSITNNQLVYSIVNPTRSFAIDLERDHINLLQHLEKPIQNADFCPPRCRRLDRMQVAKKLWTATPFERRLLTPRSQSLLISKLHNNERKQAVDFIRNPKTGMEKALTWKTGLFINGVPSSKTNLYRIWPTHAYVSPAALTRAEKLQSLQVICRQLPYALD